MNRVMKLVEERTRESTDWLVTESNKCTDTYPDKDSRNWAVCVNKVFLATITRMEEDEKDIVKEIRSRPRQYLSQ